MKLLNKEHITDALRYWEPRRIVYNLVLALTTLMTAWADLGSETFSFTVPAAIILFLLAAVANVLYSIAYPVDVFIQASEFREVWLKFRWLLFFCGLAIGMAAACLVTLAYSFSRVPMEGGFGA